MVGMRAPLAERFWAKVDKAAAKQCWEWTGTRNNKGYGMIGRGSAGLGKALAHRVSYELANGPIPNGLNILHSCDNPACVNPAHLRAGTQKENQVEMSLKGRSGGSGYRGEMIGTAKLNDEKVIAIRQAYVDGVPMNDMCEQFSVSRPTVKRVIQGKTWAHLFAVGGPSFAELKTAKRKGGWLPNDKQVLDAGKVRKMRKMFDAGVSDKDVAAVFGVDRRYVCDIRRGVNWKDA